MDISKTGEFAHIGTSVMIKGELSGSEDLYIDGTVEGTIVETRGGFNRAPLERKRSAALFARAKSLASQMNLSVGECTVGGGSDGNLTATCGVPTLDGLGAVGDGAHSEHEHVLVKTMPMRAALLAALLHCS